MKDHLPLVRFVTRALCAIALAAVVPLWAPTARAQHHGFQLEHYEPTPAGEWFLSVEHPWYSSTRYFAAGLTFDYAHAPLVFVVKDGSGNAIRDTRVVAHSLVGHLDLAFSLFDRVAATASVPLTLYEGGEYNSTVNVGPIGSVSAGDVRVGLRARILGHAETDAFSLHAGVQLWIPVGVEGNHAGDESLRVLVPRVVAAGFSHSLRWSASVGFLVRSRAALAFDRKSAPLGGAGSALQLAAAIGWTDAAHRWNIGPELTFDTIVSEGHAFDRDFTALEALASAHYLINDLILVGAGAGIGFGHEQGTPDFRAVVRVAWAPGRKKAAPVIDTDRDGIPDTEDACPAMPGPRNADPARNGCPPPTVKDQDGDGIPDEKDLCPTEPQGLHPDPTRAGCPARDEDGDGVFDYEDECPKLNAGTHHDKQRKGCPAPDSDGDGFFDDEDVCPTVHAGVHPDPARRGCPLPDLDNDSVPDAIDACPSVPGAPDPDPKKNGCPGLVQVKNGMIVIMSPVFFATGKDVILEKSFPVLQAVANALAATPEIKLLAVEGHTDNKGKAEKNMLLSDKRANSVMRFLVARGVNATRLTAQGFGQQNPIASNKTEKTRALNRRVEFRIIDPAPAAPAAAPVK